MRLYHPGANQTIVTIENQEFYFSYNTCVAICNKNGKFRIKSPSITTSHHMSNMRVSNFSLVSEEELAQHLPTTLPPLTK